MGNDLNEDTIQTCGFGCLGKSDQNKQKIGCIVVSYDSFISINSKSINDKNNNDNVIYFLSLLNLHS